MTKRALYYVENHKMEIVNTLFGKERVLLNGSVISENKTKADAAHVFTVNEHRYHIAKRDSSTAGKMNTYEIRKDGSPVALVNVASQNSVQMLLLIIAVGLGSGFIFGAVLYKILFPVSI